MNESYLAFLFLQTLVSGKWIQFNEMCTYHQKRVVLNQFSFKKNFFRKKRYHKCQQWNRKKCLGNAADKKKINFYNLELQSNLYTTTLGPKEHGCYTEGCLKKISGRLDSGWMLIFQAGHC
jgi:hypothetical protein